MAFTRFLILSFIFLILINAQLLDAQNDNRKAFIVYMGHGGQNEPSMSASLHMSMLQNVAGSNVGPKSLLRSYKRSFNGFVAMLTEEEAKKMAETVGVVSVFPSEKQKLHTTRSWDFIGFPETVKRSTTESDIIIGVLDTGISPQSQSFDDKAFGPPPEKWKGSCQGSANFTCNKKVIGARYYRSSGLFDEGDVKSPMDSDGHGTHTASTAAGGLVSGASFFGLASGTARGGVPLARIAAYKVCWSDGCADADILAAFDDAIADGVDIISVSLSSGSSDYFKNAIAIGAFHAMKQGILTSVSAGNGGPDLESIANFAPWILSVAASTTDRDFFTKLQLGNNVSYMGYAITTTDVKNLPIIYGGDAPNTEEGFDGSSSRFCRTGSLDKNMVMGKIVFCDSITGGGGPLLADAAGVVMTGRDLGETSDVYPLPTAYLTQEDGSKTYIYINSTRNPTGTISKSNQEINKLAPVIAPYSSRGPSPINPSILKPDLTAPGTNILAAWSEEASISGFALDKRVSAFNIISGTSMSCPHASAAAAYVKSFHPTWSDASIKSSLMTTANPLNADLHPDAAFAYGAGQINPVKAAFPGLVYDIVEADYVNLLCGQGYTTKLLQIVTGNSNTTCPANNGTSPDLNYPAFVTSASLAQSITKVFTRTVTNVGSPTSTYKAKVVAPPGFNVEVNPSVLSFTTLGEKKLYSVTVHGTVDKKIVLSGSLIWDDGTYQVQSPIIVYMAT